MDWTVVTRSQRQKKKLIQIFVRMNGSKATPMELNLADDKVEDVMRRIQNDEDAYVTMHGRVLKRSEKLKSCEVTDGCTIQVTSGGGRHKDKNKDAVIRMIEESEGYRKIVKMISEGSDEEYGMQCFRAELREKSGLDENHMKVLECGVRWALKQGEKKAVKNKSNGDRKGESNDGEKSRKSNGSRQSKDITQYRSEASKCVSAMRNCSRRRERRALMSRK